MSGYDDAIRHAIVLAEAERRQNPMNGDGSNSTIDQIIRALVAGDPDLQAHADEMKRRHQQKWERDYVDFHKRHNPPRDRQPQTVEAWLS